MKKKLVSLVLVVALLVSIPLSAFASVNFNSSILNGRNDIIVSTDDMVGITYIRPATVADGTMLVRPAPSTAILVFPSIGLTDPGDFFTLQFSYHSYEWAFFDSIIIKIGDNRYIFSDCSTSASVDSDGTVFENISFTAKNEILPFMNDFATNKDSEIKVRLHGASSSFDFTLTDDMKDSIRYLYALYIAGGGLSQPNFDLMSYIDKTTVTRNGVILR